MEEGKEAALQAIAGLVTALAVFDDPKHKYHQVVSAVASAARRVVAADLAEALNQRDALLRSAWEWLKEAYSDCDEDLVEQKGSAPWVIDQIARVIGEKR